jgi:hypothetical protein
MSVLAPLGMRSGRTLAPLLVLLAQAGGGVHAQNAPESSGDAPNAETVRAATAAIGRQLGSTDAKVSSLRTGRGGVLCGSVNVRNRMGTYTGPRHFVFDPGTGVAGRLPEGPELRNPSSTAEYHAMERVKALFVAHCTDR